MKNLAFIVAAILFAPAAAVAAEPESLDRTGKWIVNWADDSCMLIGAFGPEGRDQVMLRLVQFMPGQNFRLTLAGDRFKLYDTDTRFSYVFAPAQTPITANALAGTIGKTGFLDAGPSSLYRPPDHTVAGPVVTPDMEQAVTSFTFWRWRAQPTRLNLVSMKGPMAALRKCTADLVKSWGYDPVVIASLTRTPNPITPPKDLLRSFDYPLDALDKGQMAVVALRLDVDEAGKVAGCHVQESTKPVSFGELSCRLITSRATFQPALDAAGKSVKAFFSMTVKWIMGS